VRQLEAREWWLWGFERDDGTIFSDPRGANALSRKKFVNTELEWMRCSLQDLKTVLTELRTGQRFTGTHHQTFPMRLV
jgi:hypothetical protein